MDCLGLSIKILEILLVRMLRRGYQQTANRNGRIIHIVNSINCPIKNYIQHSSHTEPKKAH